LPSRALREFDRAIASDATGDTIKQSKRALPLLFQEAPLKPRAIFVLTLTQISALSKGSFRKIAA
jgi:hypothetical protein